MIPVWKMCLNFKPLNSSENTQDVNQMSLVYARYIRIIQNRRKIKISGGKGDMKNRNEGSYFSEYYKVN